MRSLPYLTDKLPGIGGTIKAHIDDFVVEEVPLYPFAGVGEHAFLLIEKRGTTTHNAISIVAKAIGRRSVDFGYAGLKDAQAVTRQWISIERETNSRFEKLELPCVKIVEQTRHRNKIKLGHLAGNRFTIKIRHEDWDKSPALAQAASAGAQAVLAALCKTGVPNFFGPQRFGMRMDNHLLGMALLKNDPKKFMDLWLGHADESVDRGGVLQARKHYDAGNLEAAYSAWPGHLHAERVALGILVKNPAHHGRALNSLDIRLRRLLVSALQAHLFNRVLEARLPQLCHLEPGDLAWIHETGAVFEVLEDRLPLEQPRCDRHDISPSGPLFGYRMTQAAHQPGITEAQVLADAGLSPEIFRSSAAQGSKGSRRAMRFFFQDHRIQMASDSHGGYLELVFTLPAGSFATVMLAEIMKTGTNQMLDI